jgi:hypothetical protein
MRAKFHSSSPLLNFIAKNAIKLLYCDYRSKSSHIRIKILNMGVGAMKPRSNPPGTKNIVGSKVVAIRSQQNLKQKDFLARLQVLGMDVSATSLSRLEGQYRLVQDFEVVILAEALGTTVNELLGV